MTAGTALAADTATQTESWPAPAGTYVLTDGTATGSRALAMVANSRAEGPLSLAAAANTIRLRAKGKQCAGAPRAIVSVDGTRVASWDVTATSYATYSVGRALTAGSHRVTVEFDNDYRSATCDRNLYVDEVIFAADTTTATPIATATPSPTPTPTPANLFYVSPTGLDTNNGLSPATAWRTTAKASSAVLPVGARLLFERGGTYTGTLTMAESNITVLGYGTNEAQPKFTQSTPGYNNGCIVDIGGDNIYDGLRLDNCSTASNTTSTTGRTGIYFRGDRSILRNSYITGNQAGVTAITGADDNKVLNNSFIDNNKMTKLTPKETNPDDDYGAYGVETQGGLRLEVGYNFFRGQKAFSYDYTWDGSCMTIYKGSMNIHHNRCYDGDNGFEGSGIRAGTDIRYNLFRNVTALVVQPDTSFAGNNDPFEFAHNTVSGGRFGSNIGGGTDLTVRRTIHTTPLNNSTRYIEDKPMTEANLNPSNDFQPWSTTSAWVSGEIAYGAHAPGGLK
jgi:hypothetical protein